MSHGERLAVLEKMLKVSMRVDGRLDELQDLDENGVLNQPRLAR
jgi:hypothetical protein